MAAPAFVPAPVSLVWFESGVKRCVPLSETPLTLGRGLCGVPFTEQHVSRIHAKLQLTSSGDVTLTALGTNATHLVDAQGQLHPLWNLKAIPLQLPAHLSLIHRGYRYWVTQDPAGVQPFQLQLAAAQTSSSASDASSAASKAKPAPAAQSPVAAPPALVLKRKADSQAGTRQTALKPAATNGFSAPASLAAASAAVASSSASSAEQAAPQQPRKRRRLLTPADSTSAKPPPHLLKRKRSRAQQSRLLP